MIPKYYALWNKYHSNNESSLPQTQQLPDRTHRSHLKMSFSCFFFFFLIIFHLFYILEFIYFTFWLQFPLCPLLLFPPPPLPSTFHSPFVSVTQKSESGKYVSILLSGGSLLWLPTSLPSKAECSEFYLQGQEEYILILCITREE